jgi:23S rRNA (cytosine1962-C5)-methyltransferase
MTIPKIILHNSKADAVKRFHPWIFSGAIKHKDPALQEGDRVEVFSASGEYLAMGFFSPGNIAIKILSFAPVETLEDLFLERFQHAYQLRQQVGLAENPQTNCYRLVNAEGDGLPGLIVDWYNGAIVLQAYSLGMLQQRGLIVECLRQVYGDRLTAIYDKSGTVLPRGTAENGYLLGESCSGEVVEYGHRFAVDWEAGQKTGLFLDQREHRQLLARYAKGKRVLNTFCYSGGFSVYAMQAGAEVVHSVDSSVRAIAGTEQNIALNQSALNQSALNQSGDHPSNNSVHQSFTSDVFDFLKNCEPDYDVIVLDPPAFAKGLSARHGAVMAYKRLNQMAFAKVRSPGVVFTFSCSQVVTPDLFKGAVMAGAIESGRRIQAIDHLTQPADHPISIYHPEGLYLKGLVLMVNE